MNRSIFYTVLLVLSVNDCCAQTTEFTFVDNDAQSSPQSYQYSVIQAGDNFNFKFDTVPEDNTTKLQAGYHVLQSVYKDSSINKIYSEHYIRE